MRPLQAINDANFVVPRLNLTGITQPTVGEKQAFADETTLDVVANPMHKAADRPHLTMNDKVFAARFGIVNLTPVSIEPETKPAPEKDKVETKVEAKRGK